MKEIISILICLFALCTLVSCNGKKAEVKTVEFTETENPVTDEVTKPAAKEFYERSDFDKLVTGKSTFDDLLEIAPESVIEEIGIGKYCKYPTKAGGLIYIEIYKKPGTSELIINNINEIPKLEADSITLNGTEYASKEINEMFSAVLNTNLYEKGSPDAEELVYNTKLLTENEIEYDLYYDPAFFGSCIIYGVVGNLHNISDGSDTPRYYEILVDSTELGLDSTFSAIAEISKTEAEEIPELKAHLGHYSFHFDGVIKPDYETPSDEWKTNVEKEIGLFVDDDMQVAVRNYTTGETGAYSSIENGDYTIYIKAFSKADKDTKVLFVNETTGKKYLSNYYSIHLVRGEFRATLDEIFVDVTDAFDSVREFSSIPEDSPLAIKRTKK